MEQHKAKSIERERHTAESTKIYVRLPLSSIPPSPVAQQHEDQWPASVWANYGNLKHGHNRYWREGKGRRRKGLCRYARKLQPRKGESRLYEGHKRRLWILLICCGCARSVAALELWWMAALSTLSISCCWCLTSSSSCLFLIVFLSLLSIHSSNFLLLQLPSYVSVSIWRCLPCLRYWSLIIVILFIDAKDSSAFVLHKHLRSPCTFWGM